jgi:toxin ParE1/3/4
VGSYTLSAKADGEIENIATASMREWGLVRAEKYILGLHRTFQVLTDFPDLGRDASNLRPGYRTMETASHSVFYRKAENVVLIVRVLHQRMDFRGHL